MIEHLRLPLPRHLCLQLCLFRELSISLPSVPSVIKVLLLYRVEYRAQFSWKRNVQHQRLLRSVIKTYQANMGR